MEPLCEFNGTGPVGVRGPLIFGMNEGRHYVLNICITAIYHRADLNDRCLHTCLVGRS